VKRDALIEILSRRAGTQNDLTNRFSRRRISKATLQTTIPGNQPNKSTGKKPIPSGATLTIKSSNSGNKLTYIPGIMNAVRIKAKKYKPHVSRTPFINLPPSSMYLKGIMTAAMNQI
jgi:hypothetical protein